MRYFCRVEYDGSAYVGWQIQNTGISIQAELQSAFSTVARMPCTITGAGRTDAGVHARAQGMHIDLPDSIEVTQLVTSVNAILPPDIAIFNCQPVDDSFHARFSATGRWYKYYITTRKTPLRRHQVLVITYRVDWERVRENLSLLPGRHDFTAFCASGSSAESKMCTITEALLEEGDNEYIFTLSADRFLYRMVRSIVGTLLDIGRGRIDDSLETIITSKNRNRVGDTVSPHGLILEYVTYPGIV